MPMPMRTPPHAWAFSASGVSPNIVSNAAVNKSFLMSTSLSGSPSSPEGNPCNRISRPDRFLKARLAERQVCLAQEGDSPYPIIAQAPKQSGEIAAESPDSEPASALNAAEIARIRKPLTSFERPLKVSRRRPRQRLRQPGRLRSQGGRHRVFEQRAPAA